MYFIYQHIITSWIQRRANLDGWGEQSWGASPANVKASCLPGAAAAIAAGCVSLQFNEDFRRHRLDFLSQDFWIPHLALSWLGHHTNRSSSI